MRALEPLSLSGRVRRASRAAVAGAVPGRLRPRPEGRRHPQGGAHAGARGGAGPACGRDRPRPVHRDPGRTGRSGRPACARLPRGRARPLRPPRVVGLARPAPGALALPVAALPIAQGPRHATGWESPTSRRYGPKMEKGDTAPDFELPDQTGAIRKLSDYLSAGPVVLFFYPAAMTPGCTKESCHYRDLAAEFGAVHAQRLGISADAVDKQHQFADKYGLDFPLLSDADRTVAKAFEIGRASCRE